MILTRLRLGDFGIFDNQEMEHVSDGTIVIAGPNRAGKTTFMQVLRYLAYPFPRTGAIPPPVKEYQVEAEVAEETAHYRIYRKGFSEPEVLALDHASARTINELFPIDAFTYRQLFTISLDELRRLPAGVGNKEARRLQSILLGAGLAEIAVLPDILRDFTREAEKIGGKSGNPAYKAFHDHYQDIQHALNERRKALEQVDEFVRIQAQVQKTKEEIQTLTGEQTREELRRDRLDFLYQYYDSFGNLQQALDILERPGHQQLLDEFPISALTQARQLSADYPKAIEMFEQHRREFQSMVDSQDWQQTMAALLEKKQVLRYWERNLSGLEQRIENFRSQNTRHGEKKQTLISRMSRLNQSWSDKLETLDSLQIDELELGQLRNAASQYQSHTEHVENLKERLEESENTRNETQERYDMLTPAVKKRWYWVLEIISVIGVGSGIWLAIMLKLWVGLTVGAAGLLGMILTGMMFLLRSERRKERERLHAERDVLDKKLETFNRQLQDLLQAQEEERQILDNYRALLEVEVEIHPDTLVAYFREAAEIKMSFGEWKAESRKLREQQQAIIQELSEITQLIKQVAAVPGELHASLEKSDLILRTLETALQWLDQAEILQGSRQTMGNLEEHIRKIVIDSKGQLDISNSVTDTEKLLHLLEEFIRRGEKYEELTATQTEKESQERALLTAFSERVQNAFKPVAEIREVDLNSIYSVLEQCYGDFLSEKELRKRLEKSQATAEEIALKLANLREQKAKMEQTLQELATTDRLEKAQEEIDRARSRMEPLAREYAVNRLSALVLEKVRDRFLEKTKNDLLGKASEIYHRLTSEEYTQILPPDDLASPDFLVEDADGKYIDSTDVLSRGTQEQLFLAIRLSRLYDLPPLPVILDDSLVNFDVRHRRQAAALVEELSHRNQTFVLTCHPEIIDYLAEKISNIQYWTVDQGIIQLADYDKVKAHLTRSK